VGRVEVGFFSFTVVPDGHHHGYNEWHQLDHLPEQYSLPGIVRGERWVATPRCAAARLVDDPMLGRAHYVTLYLLGEPLAETLRAFQALAVELRDQGRFYEHRESVYGGPLPLVGLAAAPRVLVRAEVVPFRPARGVYVVVDSVDGGDAAARPDLTAVDGVAGAWTFAGDADRITVAWLDDDPVAVAERVGGVLDPDAVRHAGPYEAITPHQWDWFG
jgi:hypothetical protein